MNWHLRRTLDWQEPISLTASFAGQDMALLYSGLSEQFTGQTSYLFLTPLEIMSGDDWSALPPLPSESGGLPLWIGYLGYEMGDDVPATTPGPITLPNTRFIRYAHVFRFDHTRRVIEQYEQPDAPALTPVTSASIPQTTIATLSSNLTRGRYESIVAATIAHIQAGDFYQANITRKFHGSFVSAPDSWALFTNLTNASPAPYSAYIRHGSSAIMSSSPECFLTVDATGQITTRPIKGSARRSADAVEDQTIAKNLRASEKNHAENLMIVDLMRNDLARVSEPKTVTVLEQSSLYSYATIHHLISTIRAKKRRDVSVYDVVRACFPPGSMTGAPKIAAMRWCAEQEAITRGIYSGAIGWFGGGDTCDLSVTIRTLILNGDQFEFQVGGGIVADSTPEDEWRETLVKARGICAALGIREADLAAL